MAFPGNTYAPPGVYTQTNFEDPTQALLAGLKLPVYIGTGSEILTQNALEVVRGSSATVDQQVVDEDLAGRSVVSISNTGVVTLGPFDGVRKTVQVRNFPIVDGNGSGTPATNANSISVTLNGTRIVVLSISANTGILELSVAPKETDDVRVTYFFNRTDTQTTDNVSEQITQENALLRGQVGETYEITEGVNDTLVLTIDDDQNTITVTLPASNPGVPWSASQISAFINSGVAGTTLVAGTYLNNLGETAVVLTADRDIRIGSGTVNSTLGFSAGDFTARNRQFFVFNGPIVTGSNGGVTTTTVTDVTVLVDGIEVTATSVDGSNRAVVLPFAPETGASVTITYYFNTWANTFDYLAHRDITDILLAGVTPDRQDFFDGVDFVLKDDLIVWGTAFLVSSGEHTQGTEFFGENQISGTLVDAKQYLAACTPVLDTTVSPVAVSTTEFVLPLTPTTGNGRNSPLGNDLFQKVSNNRIDLPTDNPNLVQAYWGFGIQDAIERGPVTVTSVDSSSSTITLQEAVPVGAEVFATFYYNTILDQDYTLRVETAGAGGVGTYTIESSNGDSLVTARFGTKGAGLAGISIEFPSGSERLPDTRYETPFDTSLFKGAVEEDVTVTFRNNDSTLAKYTVPGSDPYYPITGNSDRVRLLVDGADTASGAAGINLSAVNSIAGLGFAAALVGEEIEYDADSGYVTYDIDSTNDEINVTVDGVLVAGTAVSGSGVTVANYVTALNTAAAVAAPVYAGATEFTSPVTITAGEYDSFTIDYQGSTVAALGGITVTIPAGTYNSASLLAAAVDTAVGTAITGAGGSHTVNVTANAAGQLEFALTQDPGDTGTGGGFLTFLTQGAVQATATATINVATLTPGDIITIGGTPLTANGGVPRTPGSDDFDPSTPASAIALATEIVSAINDGANSFTAIATASNAGGTSATITLTAVPVGTLGNAVTLSTTLATPTDITLSGATFAGGSNAGANDFAVLAGIDTDTAFSGAQTKLVDGPIARRFTIVGGGDQTGANLYDRVILRNRVVPGSGSIARYHNESQATVKVEGSSGALQAGLTVNEVGLGRVTATVAKASLLGVVGFSEGQVVSGTYSDSRDGQPFRTFFADGGTTDQNNVFNVTIDGVPVTVVFTDAAGSAIPSGGSAEVPLGPITDANTILGQLDAAFTAAGITATVQQEGAGIRIVSGLDTTAGTIEIGEGSANNVLGFIASDTATREAVEAEYLVSALMARSHAAIADVLYDWENPDSGSSYFAGVALAKTQRDASNAEFLYLQSLAGSASAGLGVSSSIAWADPTTDSVLLPGVGIDAEVGDGASGETGISGFYVTSSDPVNGSGTANNSVLNSTVDGQGQDGIVGQTYRDLVTGLTFTILPRAGGSNYPGGPTDFFTFTVRRIVTTDSNLPINTINGVQLLVTNTQGVGVGDTAIVETFRRSGAEPAVGDLYYVTYEYQKQNFDTALFTKLSTIEANYGSLSTENPVTLASYLALLNGAVLVGIKQVEKDIDNDGDGIPDQASSQAFRDAVDDLEGALPGGILPDILVALKGDDPDLFAYMTQHADIQSSLRYRAERTIMAGVAAGTEPRTVGDIAQSIQRDRFRIVYPDIAAVPIPRADGADEETQAGGPFLAAAVAGSVVNPSVDVATPWTNRRILGFNGLLRILDAVEQNQVAVRGVTVLEDRPPALRIRQGLTSDMSSLLKKLPTITLIVDETQRQARATLESFVGIKFLPGVLSQIEGNLSNTLKQLVKAQILATYTGVSADTAPDDPTVIEAEAYIQPVFPVLYIILTFNLRSSL